MSGGLSAVERKLYRRMKKSCERHSLLAPGDRVMVAVSGGKDSYTLLYLLARLAARLPFEISLVAVHLDQRQPGYDGRPLLEWLSAFTGRSGVPFEILSEDTYSVVTEHVPAGATYCSLCSRLRRGILYTAAERLGCTKIALGHHRDDALETFLMNLFYSGKLQAMPARYTTDDGRFEVIRPLIECSEERIRVLAKEQGFPILPCNLCGSQEGLRREAMKALLDRLEGEHHDVRSVMMNALSNVRPTHLLDPDILAAWEARPAHIRPDAPAEPRPAHASAEPVRRSEGKSEGTSEGPSPARRLPVIR